MKKTKLLSKILALTMVSAMLLSGCGANKDVEESAQSTDVAEESTKESEVPVEEPAETPELNIDAQISMIEDESFVLRLPDGSDSEIAVKFPEGSYNFETESSIDPYGTYYSVASSTQDGTYSWSIVGKEILDRTNYVSKFTLELTFQMMKLFVDLAAEDGVVLTGFDEVNLDEFVFCTDEQVYELPKNELNIPLAYYVESGYVLTANDTGTTHTYGGYVSPLYTSLGEDYYLQVSYMPANLIDPFEDLESMANAENEVEIKTDEDEVTEKEETTEESSEKTSEATDSTSSSEETLTENAEETVETEEVNVNTLFTDVFHAFSEEKIKEFESETKDYLYDVIAKSADAFSWLSKVEADVK